MNTETNPTQTETHRQSIGSMIGHTLAEESQASAQRMLQDINRKAHSVHDYVVENPREVAGLAVTLGFMAWAAIRTKPGRLLFDAGAALAIPMATKWVARNIAGPTR